MRPVQRKRGRQRGRLGRCEPRRTASLKIQANCRPLHSLQPTGYTGRQFLMEIVRRALQQILARLGLLGVKSDVFECASAVTGEVEEVDEKSKIGRRHGKSSRGHPGHDAATRPGHSSLKSSGTSPNFFSTTTSENSPTFGSPARLNATAPALAGSREIASARLIAAASLWHSCASPGAAPSSVRMSPPQICESSSSIASAAIGDLFVQPVAALTRFSDRS